MKNKIICLGIVLISMFLLDACASILGLTKGNITGEDTSYKDPIGVQVGISVPVLDLSESINLRAEANVSMQGAKWEDDWGEGLTKGKAEVKVMERTKL